MAIALAWKATLSKDYCNMANGVISLAKGEALTPAMQALINLLANFFQVVEKAKVCDASMFTEFTLPARTSEIMEHLKQMCKEVEQLLQQFAAFLHDLAQKIAESKGDEDVSLFNMIACPQFWTRLRIAGARAFKVNFSR